MKNEQFCLLKALDLNAHFVLHALLSVEKLETHDVDDALL